MIKDSGERTEFSSGAVRDCRAGKGRFDLMPLDVMATFCYNDPIIFHMQEYVEDGEIRHLYQILDAATDSDEPGRIFKSKWGALLETAIHFEEGCAKYGDRNWMLGIPEHCFVDSAMRHYCKYKAGWTDEPHDRAFIWNVLCLIWTVIHRPEMKDIPRKGKLDLVTGKPRREYVVTGADFSSDILEDEK